MYKSKIQTMKCRLSTYIASILIFLLFLLFSSLIPPSSAECGPICRRAFAYSNEHRLLSRVFETYGDGCEECKLSRPIVLDTETMLVEFGIALIQVVELDEKRQMMTTHIWEYHVWQDNRLAWNTSEFGGLQSVNPPKSKIWNPSITLYNVIEKQMPYDHPLNVWYTGEVLWVTQAIYKSPCDVKTYNFPFDVHQCNFTFASWTHGEQQLNLTFYQNQDKILTMSYYNNPQWEIEDITMQRRLHYYQCCPEPFVQLIYSFTLRRRVAFFAFVLILPSVLLSMLTLVVFCLPHDSTDKINIGLSIFLSYFVLLMILVESTPTSGQAIPLMGQYFCVSLVIIAMSVISSTFIINIYGKRSKGPLFSKNTKKLVLILGKYLLVQGPWFHRHNHSSRRGRDSRTRAELKTYATNHWASDTNCNEPLNNCNSDATMTTTTMQRNVVDTTPNYSQQNSHHYDKLSNNVSMQTHTTIEHDLSEEDFTNDTSVFNRERGSFRMALRRGLGDSRAHLGNSHGHLATKDISAHEHHHDNHKESLRNSDWALLASLLDRIFFLIYFTINVIAASVIFTRAIP